MGLHRFTTDVTAWANLSHRCTVTTPSTLRQHGFVYGTPTRIEPAVSRPSHARVALLELSVRWSDGFARPVIGPQMIRNLRAALQFVATTAADNKIRPDSLAATVPRNNVVDVAVFITDQRRTVLALTAVPVVHLTPYRGRHIALRVRRTRLGNNDRPIEHRRLTYLPIDSLFGAAPYSRQVTQWVTRVGLKLRQVPSPMHKARHAIEAAVYGAELGAFGFL